MTLRGAAVTAVALAAASAAAAPAWNPWQEPAAAKPAPRSSLAGETSAARIVGLVAIRLYQVTVSRALPGNCQFSPSCSAYTLRCVASHGLINGVWMGADRISRCHGFAALGGYPVSRTGMFLDPPDETPPPLPVLRRLGL